MTRTETLMTSMNRRLKTLINAVNKRMAIILNVMNTPVLTLVTLAAYLLFAAYAQHHPLNCEDLGRCKLGANFKVFDYAGDTLTSNGGDDALNAAPSGKSPAPISRENAAKMVYLFSENGEVK